MNQTNVTAAAAADEMVIEVGAADLLGPGAVACPNPRMPLWATHPRVFIDVATAGEGKCPYCGRVYKLAPGTVLHGH